jgi:hypothetical protein
MMHKLIQKHILHGRQEFEIRDEFVKVKINSLLKKKKELDIELAMLNPEPVISGSWLHFHSRVKCGPLISLYLNKPNAEEFNAFVDAIKAKAKMEYAAFAGLKN